MAEYRTSLKEARGLGSAKQGVGTWIVERVTSLALVPLVVWAVWSGLVLAGTGYDGAVGWLSSPFNVVPLVLLLLVGFWHMQIGLRAVIEDYIHKPSSKATLLVLNLFVCALAAVVSIFCVLKVAITGGVH